MAYVIGNIPFVEVMIRAEYTANLDSRSGEWIKGYAHAVRCVRASSLMFSVTCDEPHGGAEFTLPIEALCWRATDAPASAIEVQPWDVFSSDFGVCEMDFHKRGAALTLPERGKAQYRFTIDFVGTDLAENFEQHKALHVVMREDGRIGAYPNNRLLWVDDAFWKVTDERPPFVSLAGEYRAEGCQANFRRQPL